MMDHPKEMKRYLKLHAKAQKENNAKEESDCCNILGNYYLQEGEYDEALLMHRSELNICEALQDVTGQAIANRNIGDVYVAMGEFEKGITHHKRHLQLSADNLVELQRANTSLGRTYIEFSRILEDKVEASKALLKSVNLLLKSLKIATILKDEKRVNQREGIEMKIRSLINLGVSYHQLSSIASCKDKISHNAKSKESFQKAVYLSQRYNCDEDLYLANYILTTVNTDLKQYSAAIRNAQSSLVLAKKINKKDLIIQALDLCAQVYLMMENIQAAKTSLKEIYKKYPKSRDEVEAKLKTVIRMWHTKKEISAVRDDLNRLYSLHESLADLFCELQCYYPAVKHYKAQEDLLSELPAVTTKQRVSVYFSIGSTLVDVGEYDEAMTYYEKELNSTTDIREKANTFTHMSVAMVKKGEPYKEVETYYLKAMGCAEVVKDDMLKLKTLVSLEETQRIVKESDLAFETRRRITDLEIKLGINADDLKEDEDTGESCSPDIIDDLFEEEMELLSEEDDEEVEETSRKKRRSNFMKKNEKGETLLHQACIVGQLKSVEVLVRQGHHINPRDFCGWIPLHEACNHGYNEIVDFLLHNGAHINDIGGEFCDNITPINDAATNGHFDVVDTLLKHGADPNIANTRGQTAFDSLRHYYQRHREDLDESSKKEYKNLYIRLQAVTNQSSSDAMEDSGERNVRNSHPSSTETSGDIDLMEDDLPELNKHLSKKPVLRSQNSVNRGFSVDEYDDFDESDEQDETVSIRQQSVTRGNRGASEALRSISNIFKDAKAAKIRRIAGDTALVDEDFSKSFHDDIDSTFLYLDKTKRAHKLLKNTRSGRSSPFLSAFSSHSDEDLPISTLRSQIKRSENKSALVDRTGDIIDVDDDDWLVPDDDLHSQPIKRKRRNGNTLAEFPLNIENFSTTSTAQHPAAVQPTLNTVTNIVPVANIQNVLRLKVKVNDKHFIIPVPGRDKNIGWLIEKATSRYEELTNLRPLLSLSTSDGCLLSSDDLVCDVLGYNDFVTANIEAWEIMSLSQSYVEQCKKDRRPRIPALVKACEECDVTKTFNLLHLGFSFDRHLKPLVSSFQQQEVHKIFLPGNQLGHNGVTLLCKSFEQPTPQSRQPMEELDLTCNDLDSDAVKALSECSSFHNLKSLNLSFNPLCEGRSVQCILTNFKNLRTLILRKCCLSQDIFSNLTCPLDGLKQLEHLNISKNNFGSYGLLKWLQLLDRTTIKRLYLCEIADASNNTYITSHLVSFLQQSDAKLEIIDLSLNQLSSEHFETLRSIRHLVPEIHIN